MFALNALMSLAMAAAEPTAEQSSNQPSMALLLYLDEFSDQDDDVVDLALVCTNETTQQNEQAEGLQELVQCETLPSASPSSSALKTSSSETTPHE